MLIVVAHVNVFICFFCFDVSILVTSGAGFMGANFVRDWLAGNGETLGNVDKLAYAGKVHNLPALQGDALDVSVQTYIEDREAISGLLCERHVRAVVYFAAESHVDRSLDGPGKLIQTNVVGMHQLLEAARGYWQGLADAER